MKNLSSTYQYRLVNLGSREDKESKLPTQSAPLMSKSDVIHVANQWIQLGVEREKIMVQHLLEDEYKDWRMYWDYVNIEINDLQLMMTKENVLRGVAYSIWNYVEAQDREKHIEDIAFYIGHGLDINEYQVTENLQRLINEIQEQYDKEPGLH